MSASGVKSQPISVDLLYTEVLVTGQGNASATGKPLGDKFS